MPRGLRILGYHGVRSAEHFETQVKWLVRHFQPIGPTQTIEVLRGKREVASPIWVTFDDGDPSVVETALPVLERHGVPATMFVCPGLIDSDEPYWWDIIETAALLGLEVDGRRVLHTDVGLLKTQLDPVRRSWVARVQDAAELKLGAPLRRPQLTLEQLQTWARAGQTVGNHSWDHPILDRCDVEAQHKQIVLADEWLVGRGVMATRLFAYPNGNATSDAKGLLSDLGYELALLFDHRVASMDSGINVSRLMVNSDDPMFEYRARVTGAHAKAQTIFGTRHNA